MSEEENKPKAGGTADLGIKNMSDEERERARMLTEVNPSISAEETLRRLREQANKPVPSKEETADEIIKKIGATPTNKKEEGK